jgi:hypothetical protein
MSIRGHLGNYNTATSRTHVRFGFSTHEAAGANVAPSSAFEAADLRIYKATDGAALSATQRSSANGITMTSPFDSLTGVHTVTIDLSDNSDSGFYATGCYYEVWLCPDETVDGQTITGVCLCSFEVGVPVVNVVQWAGQTTSVNASNLPVVATKEVYDAAEDAYTTLGFTAGALIVDLYSINGTTLTEGAAGRLAGAFSTFFDVASPVLTVAQAFPANFSTLTIANNAVNANVTHNAGTAITASGGRQEVIVSTNNDKTGYAIGTNGIQSSSFANGAITVNAFASGAITSTVLAANSITNTVLASSAVEEIQTNLVTATTLNLLFGGLYLSGDGETTIGDTGNDTTHLHLPEVSHPDDELNGLVIVVRDVGDTNARVVRRITDWVASTQLATLDSALPFTPQDQVDTYFILSVKDTGALATAANLATAQGNITDILADTNELQTNQGNWLTADVSDLPTNAELATALGTLNDLDATEVQTAAAAALTAYDPPTNAEMVARTLAAADYATATAVADVPTVAEFEARTIVAANYATASAVTAIQGATFDTATDSLEAIRNRGDSAWTTATGFSTHSAGDVVTALGTGSSLTAVKLASDGLDSISTAAPTGVASNFREMLVAVWRRLFKRTTKSATQIITYADNGTTPITTQAITSVGDDQEQGAAS